MKKNSGIPYYLQIEESIKRAILNNQYLDNQILKSSLELQKEYKVSEIIIRKVLTRLAEQGICSRIKGTGTILNPDLPYNKLKPMYNKIALITSKDFIKPDSVGANHEIFEGFVVAAFQNNVALNMFTYSEFLNFITLPDIDAIFFLGSFSDNVLAKFEKIRLPIITIYCIGSFLNYCASFDCDSKLLGKFAATKLCSSHRIQKIYIFKWKNGSKNSHRRAEGASNYLQEKNIDFKIIELEKLNNDFNQTFANINSALAKCKLTKNTGIIAVTDELAFFILKNNYSRGIQAGKNYYLIGIDGTTTARYLSPSLSTVQISKQTAGGKALSFYIKNIKAIQAGKVRKKNILLPFDYIPGQTC